MPAPKKTVPKAEPPVVDVELPPVDEPIPEVAEAVEEKPPVVAEATTDEPVDEPKNDATQAADEATESDDKTLRFVYKTERFNIDRSNIRRAAVRAGWQVNDAGLIVQGLLGTEEFKWFIQRHAEDDLDDLLMGFLSAYGEAVGAPNSPS
jgi:hypothetical protein